MRQQNGHSYKNIHGPFLRQKGLRVAMPPGRPPKRPGEATDLDTPDGTAKCKLPRLDRDRAAPNDFSSVVKSKLQSYTRTGQACDRCKVCLVFIRQCLCVFVCRGKKDRKKKERRREDGETECWIDIIRHRRNTSPTMSSVELNHANHIDHIISYISPILLYKSTYLRI